MARETRHSLHARVEVGNEQQKVLLDHESDTGHFRGIRAAYIDSAMSVHQLTDDDVAELLRLDKAGKVLEFYTLLADLQKTRPNRGVLTTAPATRSTRPVKGTVQP